MSIIRLLGGFSDIFGPDIIIMFALMMACIAGIVLLVVFLIRRGGSSRLTGSSEERLRKLDALHNAGSISRVEYEEQRRRIIAEI